MIPYLATKLFGLLCLCIVIRLVVIVLQWTECANVSSPPHRHRTLRFLGNLTVFW